MKTSIPTGGVFTLSDEAQGTAGCGDAYFPQYEFRRRDNRGMVATNAAAGPS